MPSPRAYGGRNRRFESAEIDPSQAIGLQPDHPALVAPGRTIFPSTVVKSKDSPRFLVSGANNPKLGKDVLKGERKGWPIYHLTLEERATCPTTCEQWSTCYGNAMPQSRRHAVDHMFLPLLRGEVFTLARANPKGLLIRLHALGDFYSPHYVMAWAELLAEFPQIHVFGYTARRVDDADPLSRKTAQAIAVLTEAMWDRFAIRTSSSDPVARSRSIVVDEDPELPDVIVCPAQTGATEACSTCGLCWSGSARDKTIAFLRHGMRRATGPRPRAEAPAEETPEVAAMRARIIRRPEPIPPPPPKALAAPQKRPEPRNTSPAADGRPLAEVQAEQALSALVELCIPTGYVQISLSELAARSGIPTGSMVFNIRRLEEAGKITVEKPGNEGGARKPNIYRVLGAAEAVEPAPSPPQPEPTARDAEPTPLPASLKAEPTRTPASALLHLLKGIASPQGTATGSALELCTAAGIRFTDWDVAKGVLIKRGEIRLLKAPVREGGAWAFRIGPYEAEPKDAVTQAPACPPPPKPTPPPIEARPVVAKAPATPKPISEETFIPDELDRPYTGPCTLLNVRARDCHWPVGDGRPQLYCAKAVEGDGQYCPDHARAMFAGAKSKAPRPLDPRARDLHQQAARDRRMA